MDLLENELVGNYTGPSIYLSTEVVGQTRRVCKVADRSWQSGLVRELTKTREQKYGKKEEVQKLPV